MRRDLEAARRRLTWYGARRWQLRLLTVTESAIVAVAGTVIGLARRCRWSGLWRRGAPARRSVRCSARACSPRPGSLSRSPSSSLATVVVAIATSIACPRREPLRPARRRRARRARPRRRRAARRRRRPVATRRERGHRARPAPPAGADRVRGRRRRGAPLRAARPPGRPPAPSQRRGPSRRRDARPRPGCRRRHRRLPHARLRPRAARRGLPGHARPGRERPGVVRRSARHRRPGGPEVAHPRARCRAPRALRRARRRVGRGSGGADPRQRRRTRRGSAGSPCSACPPPRSHGCTAGASGFSGRVALVARLGGDAAGGRRAAGDPARLAAAASTPGRASSRCGPRSWPRRALLVDRARPARRRRRRRTSTARCRRACAAASSSRSSSCRRASSTAEPMPADPSPGTLRLGGLPAQAWLGEGGIVADAAAERCRPHVPDQPAERRAHPRAAGDGRRRRLPCS